MHTISILTFIKITWIFLTQISNVYVVSLPLTPSTYPLKYVTFPAVVEYIFGQSQSIIANSLLPENAQDAVAIFISEGVCGALGGVAVKAISTIDGNKNNKDSSLLNAEISGAYFGVTGAIRSLAQIAGLSPIAVNLFALFLATLISEFIKFRSRTIEPQRTRVGVGPSMYDLMKFKNPSMFDLMKFRNNGISPFQIQPRMPMLGKFTETELKADVIRWVLVYSLLPSGSVSVPVEDAVFIGAISGLFSQLVREKDDAQIAIIDAELANSNRKPWDRSRRVRADYSLTRLARASIEGATQLFAYEASRDYVRYISPYFQNSNNINFKPSDYKSPLQALISLLGDTSQNSISNVLDTSTIEVPTELELITVTDLFHSLLPHTYI